MEPAPHVILRLEDREERIAVNGRLFVGRECSGVDPAQRLIINDRSVSRDHLEVRLDGAGGAVVFDTSRNGTWLNGMRLERAVPVALSDGDVLQLGGPELVFVAPAPVTVQRRSGNTTVIQSKAVPMALVAGDVVGYSTMSEGHSGERVATAVEQIFGAVREELARNYGTLSHVAGDALFAVWDLHYDSYGTERAVHFAIAAASAVRRVSKELPMRGPDGGTLRMGWGVTVGDVGMSSLTGAGSTVLGDAVNVAFRLATMAGREGLPSILVTAEVTERTGDRFTYGDSLEVAVKGRTEPVRVLSVVG